MSSKEEVTLKAVLDYLTVANRPYSTNDVFLNLHKEHGKPSIQRVIDLMVTDGRLKVKVNGKQTCYFVNQDLLETCSEEELAALDEQCKVEEEKAKVLSDKVKVLEIKLKSLVNSMTNSQAKEELSLIEEENRNLAERLDKLENNQQVVSAEEKSQITLLHSTTVSLWKKRKRMATEVLDSILEGWPKSKQSLLDEVGVDTDESVGVKLPTA